MRAQQTSAKDQRSYVYRECLPRTGGQVKNRTSEPALGFLTVRQNAVPFFWHHTEDHTRPLDTHEHLSRHTHTHTSPREEATSCGRSQPSLARRDTGRKAKTAVQIFARTEACRVRGRNAQRRKAAARGIASCTRENNVNNDTMKLMEFWMRWSLLANTLVSSVETRRCPLFVLRLMAVSALLGCSSPAVPSAHMFPTPSHAHP